VIMALILDLYGRGGGTTASSPGQTTIEFAIFDEETLTSSPEPSLLEEADPSPEALESPLTTQSYLDASSTTPSELLADTSFIPSLGGAASGDLGSGLGGSGGAGTSFFGIESKGGRFCYIMDVSASMLEGERMSAAIQELIDSLKKLPNFSQFYILFYSSTVTEPPSQHGWNSARRTTLTRITNEIYRIQPSGGTEPTPAFEQAMELRPLPDVIFFLTDGLIPATCVDDLRNMLPPEKRIVVHAVAFGSHADIDQMKEIAKLTGGQYKAVRTGGSP
jgi:hypothetical protein